jgi:parvulin-like peptidyl-prolyl isomerase
MTRMLYPFHHQFKIGQFICGLVIVSLLAACGGKKTSTPFVPPIATTATLTSVASGQVAAPMTVTPLVEKTAKNTPTPTLIPGPLAAEVNGEGITLVEFQAELGRYQAAQKSSGGVPLADKDQQQVVINDMVDNLLLAQAAVRAGHLVTGNDIQTRIGQLVNQLGDNQALTDWEGQHGYNDASFRQSLALSMHAAWQRDQIIARIPDTADQVHVVQILVYNEDDAKLIYSRLQSGADFATLAVKIDPVMGGDLDWFPQGFLTTPEVDKAAFLLTPGKVSEIIKSKVGYHIILVLERDLNHSLTPQTRAFIEKQVLRKWLEDSRAQSKINIFLP